VGYWLKHRRHFGLRPVIMLAAVLLAGYVCHLVPTAMAGFFVVVLALIMGGGGVSARLRRLAPVIVAGAPVALLAIWFLLSQRSTQHMDPYPYPSRLWRLKDLVSFQKAFSRREVILAAMNFALFAGVSVWLLLRRQRRRFNVGVDAFLLMAVFCGALFFVMPDAGAGGILLVVRLAMFPFLALLLWWAAQPIGSEAFHRLRLACTTVATTVTLLLVASMSVSYAQLAPYFRDAESAALRIEPNSTLLVAAGGPFPAHGPDVLSHGGYRQTAERGIAIVNCGLAMTDYHSIKFRPGLNPGYETMIDLKAYTARTGKQIDYVLLFTGGVISDTPETRLILDQIPGAYDLIYSSPRTGCAKLYRRKNWSEPTDPLLVGSLSGARNQ
jgi:hypothetical protein